MGGTIKRVRYIEGQRPLLTTPKGKGGCPTAFLRRERSVVRCGLSGSASNGNVTQGGKEWMRRGVRTEGNGTRRKRQPGVDQCWEQTQMNETRPMTERPRYLAANQRKVIRAVHPWRRVAMPGGPQAREQLFWGGRTRQSVGQRQREFGKGSRRPESSPVEQSMQPHADVAAGQLRAGAGGCGRGPRRLARRQRQLPRSLLAILLVPRGCSGSCSGVAPRLCCAGQQQVLLHRHGQSSAAARLRPLAQGHRGGCLRDARPRRGGRSEAGRGEYLHRGRGRACGQVRQSGRRVASWRSGSLLGTR